MYKYLAYSSRLPIILVALCAAQVLVTAHPVSADDRHLIYGGPFPRSGANLLRSFGDINGDGTTDVVWRSPDTGQICVSLIANGSRVDSMSIPSALPADWSIAAIDDFNDDGAEEALIRSRITGETSIWHWQSESAEAAVSTSQQYDLTWRVEDAGDFDGDGHADILWRSQQGELRIWKMINAIVADDVRSLPQNRQATWHIRAVDDFDNDGKADILWLRTDGQLYIWFMDGNRRRRMGRLDTRWHHSQWEPLGAGDFYGLGQNSIVWRHVDQHSLFLWNLAGETVLDIQFLATEEARPLPTPPSVLPNIVLVVADNLGMGDFGCYGSADHRTPNVDQLAAAGTRFNHCYAASPVCTAARAALLTGCYPRRNSMDEFDWDGTVLRPVSPYGLHEEEITLADLAREQGYRTACFGKWHLGDQNVFLPTRQGFDQFKGILYSDEMDDSIPRFNWPPLALMSNERVWESGTDVTDLTRRLTRHAQRFIRDDSEPDAPFFLFYPTVGPGSRVEPVVADKWLDQSENGRYGAMVEELDWSTGEIVKTLQNEGQLANTIFIVTADNGAPPPRTSTSHGSNAPYPDRVRWNASEGGFHVPLVVSWPDQMPAGLASDQIVSHMDLFVSLARLAGTDAVRDRAIDGIDRSELFKGQSPAADREHFFYYYGGQLQAVRWGPWKLTLGLEAPLTQIGMGLQGVIVTGRSNRIIGEPTSSKLCHLLNDPHEELDLSDAYPGVLAAMQSIAAHARLTVGDVDTDVPSRPAGFVADPTPQLP